MADIFLSYAREDVVKAKLLAEALEKQGWSVFWDRSGLLAGDDFDEVIEREIELASCMIVAWSEASRTSNWVRGEAQIGLEHKILVPILIEEVKPPIAFRSIHTDDLSAWTGDITADAFTKLQRAITTRIPVTTPPPTKAPANAKAKILASTPTKPQANIVTPKTNFEPDMIVIPAGSFYMGSDSWHDDEKPLHQVELKSFLIGRYPVTFDLFDQFTDAQALPRVDDYGWGRGKRPVINVSWKDAVRFAQWLSEKCGKHFRLPTEAEWEYAARAGTTGDYYWDNNDAKNYAWFTENSNAQTHPVGQKKANAFGLNDMSGNVWEWVQDCYADDYKQAPRDGSAWEPKNCTFGVLRGGSWDFKLDDLRSASRIWSFPGYRGITVGFRLAQDLP